MSPVVMWICGGLLVVAAVLTVLRIEKGPTMLDRTIALDMLIGAVMSGLAIWSAATGRSDLVNVLVVLALVGFVGSVTLARFVAVEPEDEGRILTPEEARAAARENAAAAESLEREDPR